MDVLMTHLDAVDVVQEGEGELIHSTLLLHSVVLSGVDYSVVPIDCQGVEYLM
jgi:hypothetical protein